MEYINISNFFDNSQNNKKVCYLLLTYFHKIGYSSSLLFSGNDKLIFVFLSSECLSFLM